MIYVKEEEALNMRCPLLTPTPFAEGFNCVGAECMAWQWRSKKDTNDKHGYCGMACRREGE